MSAVAQRFAQRFEEVKPGDDGGTQASLSGERGLAQIERVSENLQSKVKQFENREEALRERFQQAID